MKSIMKQVERDQKVQVLAHAMYDAYQFVDIASPLADIEPLQTGFMSLASLTKECAQFICWYAKNPSFCASLSTVL
jgi:hypothetical protein